MLDVEERLRKAISESDGVDYYSTGVAPEIRILLFEASEAIRSLGMDSMLKDLEIDRLETALDNCRDSLSG